MANESLAQLLAEDMRLKGLSTRDVSAETGVAHTTIARILRHHPVSVSTLKKVAKYLNADTGSFVSDGDNIEKTIATIVAAEPALAALLNKAASQMKEGQLPPNVLREILRYAAWRINEVSADNA